MSINVRQNIPLAQFTTFKIGGPAKFFVEVKTKDEIIEAVEWARNNKERFFILAGGSNVLINDKGVSGLVIKINNNDIAARGERLDCGAGASLSQAVTMAAGAGLTGLEWAAGIPGTIGGAVRGNAGAFGRNIGELVETVEVLNTKKRRFKILSQRDCEFNYRESIFKRENFEHSGLIWRVVLKLRKAQAVEIKRQIDKYLRRRSNVQPKLPSAGCIFKNVAIANLRGCNENLANKAMEDKVVNGGKVSAGWFIDLLGFKGKAIGGAKVSLEHANFIVNTGKATAEDVITLISFIKQQVRIRFGLQLMEEVQYLGF